MTSKDRTEGLAVSRRTALRTIGVSAGAIAMFPALSDEGVIAFVSLQQTNAAPAPRVLTTAQYAALDAFTDAIIPTDDRSPGAKEARVADYIDLLLSEADDPLKQRWIDGLTSLDAEATRRFSAPFAKLDATQTETLMIDISKNERAPTNPVEEFFAITKNATIHGYYTSEIGIHKDLRYQGNQYLPEFVGCQTEDGKDCPHCGQKATPKGSGE